MADDTRTDSPEGATRSASRRPVGHLTLAGDGVVNYDRGASDSWLTSDFAVEVGA